MQLAPGTVVGERYVVEALLGQGGMAVVYRVRHRSLGTAHALKLVGTTSGSARQRLLREGRLQGQLQHPNVVAVTDQVEVQGVPGLVLELVDGPSLAQLLGTPLSVDQIDALGAGILAGVAAAHGLGLVHRDLKPGNVLVAVEAGRAVPKVTDFGLAVDPGDGERGTRTGATLGTPEYMAPEQVRSARDVDARADVWALGVLLYELATGALPFEDPDRFALFQRITSGEHRPLRAVRADLPERMYATVESALRVGRDERPADAAALLSAWSAEVQEARIDDLARRVLQLAPSATSSGGDATPSPALSAPGATWAPHPTVAVAEPAPPPSGELPPPPRPAVVPPPPAPTGWAVAVGMGVGGALVAALLVAMGVAVGALWWSTRPPPAPTVVVAPPPPTSPLVLPTVQGAELEAHGIHLAEPAKAREALRDARFLATVDEAFWFLATAVDATLLTATGAEALGSLYQAREEATKGARKEGPSSPEEAVIALIAGRTGPIDAYVAAHPEEVAPHLWRAWALCPGPRCTEVVADVRALEAAADGRGAPLYLAQYQAREAGHLAEAEAALDAWARVVGDDPMVAVERSRLRLAQGRAAEVPALVATLPDPFARRSPWGFTLAALAAIAEGNEVARTETTLAALRQPVATRVHFARHVAPALAARGGVEEADQLLNSAVDSVYLKDEISTILHAELQLLRAELALERGDRTVVEDAVDEVAGSARRHRYVGWTKERAERLALIAEGLRLVARGKRDAAQRRLADLEAAGPDVRDLEVLRRALAR